MNEEATSARAAGREAMRPLALAAANPCPGAAVYRRDRPVELLLKFFEAKGLARLKEEDRREQWYDDWIEFQGRAEIYAELLTPAPYAKAGGQFEVLRYARFLEVFAYCSPAHGYSLQVTFLGFFSILLGTNEALKREAAAALQAGGLLALGVSERAHGSDLLANEFTVAAAGEEWVANGAKYYIGNADHAALISVLGRTIDSREGGSARLARAPFMLVALRPRGERRSAGFRSLGKIHTLGVRAANVAGFEVKDHRLPAGDVIAQGRNAWDAVFGTVTLGKFFLGFGSIGICEHALEEARAHLGRRVLYGKPAAAMPHIRAALCQAYARLMAMKLYAYRTLDYVHTASANDRRYLLFCAVQKARVSTEGVKVMALLAECMGAKALESDTYCEMALRDIALIPGLEGSMHINLGLAAQFIPRYFDTRGPQLEEPPSLIAGEAMPRENPYLTQARTGGLHAIAFRHFLAPYRPRAALGNVMLFARQAAAFRRVIRSPALRRLEPDQTHLTLRLSQCLATIVYGQLIAEAAVRVELPTPLTSVLFGILVEDLTQAALAVASLPELDAENRAGILRLVKVPGTLAGEWESVAQGFLPAR